MAHDAHKKAAEHHEHAAKAHHAAAEHHAAGKLDLSAVAEGFEAENLDFLELEQSWPPRRTVGGAGVSPDS